MEEDIFLDTSIVKEEYMIVENHLAFNNNAADKNGFTEFTNPSVLIIKTEPEESLKSEDFTVEKYPEVHFQITTIEEPEETWSGSINQDACTLCIKKIEKVELPEDKPAFTCKICKEKFMWMKGLRMHYRKCVLANPSWEPEDHEYTENTEITEKPTKPQVVKFSCIFCDYESFNKLSVERHQKICKEAVGNRRNRPKYRCKLCEAQYLAKGNVQRHYKKCVAKKKSLPNNQLTCYACRYSFYDESVFEDHKKLCKGLPGYRASFSNEELLEVYEYEWANKCPICLKEFLGKSSLRDHTKHHTEYKPEFTCSRSCRNTFVLRADWLEHQHSCVKTKKTKFFCPWCGNRFHTTYAVRQHQLICLKTMKALRKRTILMRARSRKQEDS